ncbi:MAG: putative undecaprenyl-phosphate N-acetylglucosaminyl 1-phosphate transferase [Lentisphaerae bacterium ADurb.Bin082]|nr:MAG: putative undecaprenyl-phosphate N-acetylglucosaminyl 1-phosphate transferase [Lentisphaerae bacterium ADurb.Bin082]
MPENILETLRVAAGFGLASCLVSLLLTRLLLWLLPKWGMIDKPDFARHIHKRAVPRGGGLGMMLAFVGVIIAYALIFSKRGIGVSLSGLWLLLPLGILLPLGVLDDRFGLMARTKFLFQGLAALLAWFLGCRFETCFGLHFPVWLSLPLTILWIVAFINAFNMIDGVDGLAAGVGIISALCMATTAIMQQSIGLCTLLVVFVGALLGFLYYNWHPARLFMGDTGSMFIGYILAIAGLRLNAQTVSVASIGIPLLACGIPVIDISLAVWRRIVGIASPSANAIDAPAGDEDDTTHRSFPMRLAALVGRLGKADQSHVHHRLLRHFQNNQRKTIYAIYSLALMMGLVGVMCAYLPNKKLLLAIVVILGTFSYIINRLATIELWNSTEKLYASFQSARTGVIIAYGINPIVDIVSILCAYWIGARGQNLLPVCLIRHVGIVMLILAFSRSYRVLWNFAASDDYFRLARTLIFGFLLAYASDFVFKGQNIEGLHKSAVGIAVTLILLERLSLHYFRNDQIRRHALADGEKPVRTLLIGVTPMSRLYRNLLASDIERAGREEIVGLLALDARFVHSYCFGMKVLGTVNDLERVAKEHEIGKVLMTTDVGKEWMNSVQCECRNIGVQLQRFKCTEERIEF